MTWQNSVNNMSLWGMPEPALGSGIYGGEFAPANITLPTNITDPSNTSFTPSFMDNLVGWKDSKTGVQHGGWGGLALGAGSALMNGFMGMKQYGLMKDSLKEQKRQFNTNFDAQKKMVTNFSISRVIPGYSGTLAA